MPIKPENAKKYPRNWKSEIVPSIRARSGNCCEGSPAYPDCRVPNGKHHPVTGSMVVLTVGHLNHDPADCAPENLKHWCQRCHNTYDLPYRRKNAERTRHEKKALADLFPNPASKELVTS